MILLLSLLIPCHAGNLPDPACTPGSVATTGLAIICHQRTTERRHVVAATKRRVLAAYGLTRCPRGACELDHFIPLSLGGGNDFANLWPEPAPGYQAKDRLEATLHREVCAGRMRIEDAWKEIRTW